MISWDQPGTISKGSPTYSLLIVVNVLVMTFLAVLSAVSTIIADQSIQGELALSQPQTTWITTLYLLGVNTIVPASNWFAERFGYKTMYALGATLFTLSSVLAALAFNFETIAIARLFEGMGAGFIFPIGLATLVQNVPPKRLNLSLILYIGASFGAGFTLGLPLAGYLAQYVSWRMIFLLFVPIGLGGAISCWLVHEETPRKRDLKFDAWGFTAFSLFIASFLVALTYGPLPSTDGGWRSPYILGLFAIAATSFAFLIVIEKRNSNPIIPLGLFKNPIFAVATMAMFLLGMSIFASVGTMMEYMINALKYEKYVSGKLGMVYGITLFAFSLLGNLLLKKIPAALLTFVGLGILVYSYFLNNILDWQTGPDQTFWILLLRGMGLGLSLGPTTIQAMQHVPKEFVNKGATLLTFFRQVGGTYGGTLIAILTIKRQIFHTARFGEQANEQLPGYQTTYKKVFSEFAANTSDSSWESAQQAKGAIIHNILEQSYIQSINDAMIVFGYVTAIVMVALAALSVRNYLHTIKSRVD